SVAAMVDWINENKDLHVLCLEEPVEYVHGNKRSVVSQRDIGVDIATFYDGVRGALRHDPDVIAIGEMRDPDTIRSAITAAATCSRSRLACSSTPRPRSSSRSTSSTWPRRISSRPRLVVSSPPTVRSSTR